MVQKNETNCQSKLKFHGSLQECPDFEQYLKLSNPKFRQRITKIRISAHKFPIETEWYENKNPSKRLCPLCCEKTDDECHYLITCKRK